MLLQEMSRRDELLMMISDAYKSVAGYRPRGLYLDKTDAELEQIFEELQVEVIASIEAEEKMKNAAAAEFEAKLVELIESGAKDRETAIRWMRESYEDEYMVREDSYFEFTMNLPYGYLKGK